MTGKKQAILKGVSRRLGIDRRALTVFRVSLGLLVICDLILRSRELTTFYTDDGVFPRSVLSEVFPPLSVSVHALSGELWFQVLLFVITGVFGLALSVGWKPTTSCFVCFVLVASMYARNPYVLNGGNTMFLVFLLVGIVLPLEKRWSYQKTKDDGTSNRVFSLSTVTALVFLVTIYVTNSVLRYRSDEWMSGDAVQYVFGLESQTVALGEYLVEVPVLLVAINWVWAAMLTLSVGLLFLTGWKRAVFASLFVASHIGMALTLWLGLFPFVVIAGLVLFFPPVFWDSFEGVLESKEGHIRRRFDRTGKKTGGTPKALEVIRRTARVRLIPEAVRLSLLRFSSLFVVLLLVGFLFWQGAALGYVGAPGDGNVHPEEYSWKMFAPNPPDSDGWFVLPVRVSDGRVVDGLGRGFDTENPSDIGDTYPNMYWQRYLSEVRYSGDPERRALAEYLCVRSSETHNDARSVSTVYVERDVVLDGVPEPEGERRRYELYSHDCNE